MESLLAAGHHNRTVAQGDDQVVGAGGGGADVAAHRRVMFLDTLQLSAQQAEGLVLRAVVVQVLHMVVQILLYLIGPAAGRIDGIRIITVTGGDLQGLLQGIQLSEEARRSLPGGELEIDLATSPDEPDAKRIALLLRWQDRTGEFVRPVRLVAWKYQGI